MYEKELKCEIVLITSAAICLFVLCIPRLEELTTLFIHKNKLTYLPMSLANITTINMIVVTGDDLTRLPARLGNDPAIK